MNKKLITSLVTAVASAVLVICISGCAWSIGEGKPVTATQPPTKGQELIDLKKAHEQGAIDAAEYENQKKQVLNR